MTKKQEAKKVLELLGMPTEQQSVICCCSLLALLKLSSSSAWSSASNEWTRIHDIFAFLCKNYRESKCAENSREIVRNAARQQSFPDWYEFSGTKEQQLTMIGSAVPPMFSYKLAQSVVRCPKQDEKYAVLAGLAKTVADLMIKAASLAVLQK